MWPGVSLLAGYARLLAARAEMEREIQELKVFSRLNLMP